MRGPSPGSERTKAARSQPQDKGSISAAFPPTLVPLPARNQRASTSIPPDGGARLPSSEMTADSSRPTRPPIRSSRNSDRPSSLCSSPDLLHAKIQFALKKRPECRTIAVPNLSGHIVDTCAAGFQQLHRTLHPDTLEVRQR